MGQFGTAAGSPGRPALSAAARDENGVYFGFKSTTLEAVGLLLPFLTIPHLLRAKSVILEVDNAAVVRGWHTRSVKNDAAASTIIRAVHVLATFLACTVSVRQVPRRSTAAADLADRLSRRSTTRGRHRRLIRGAQQPAVTGALLRWLAKPALDWEFWRPLLSDVTSLL